MAPEHRNRRHQAASQAARRRPPSPIAPTSSRITSPGHAPMVLAQIALLLDDAPERHTDIELHGNLPAPHPHDRPMTSTASVRRKRIVPATSSPVENDGLPRSGTEHLARICRSPRTIDLRMTMWGRAAVGYWIRWCSRSEGELIGPQHPPHCPARSGHCPPPTAPAGRAWPHWPRASVAADRCRTRTDPSPRS